MDELVEDIITEATSEVTSYAPIPLEVVNRDDNLHVTINIKPNFLDTLKLGEDLFVIQILSFLTAKDLCQLACVSNVFSSLTNDQFIWKVLLKNDFTADDRGASSPVASRSPSTIASKLVYIRRYKEVIDRINQAKNMQLEQIRRQRHDSHVFALQTCIDITQVRILGPLPILAAFLTILLLAIKYGGTDISIWICFAPLLFFLLYTILSSQLVAMTYSRQFDPSSIFHGLWPNTRGPLRFMFINMLSESTNAVRASILALFLTAAQLVLLALKLDDSDNGNYSYRDQRHSNVSAHKITSPSAMPWGLVFVPLWTLFFLSSISPLFGCIRGGAYIAVIVTLWIPFFVLFVCLTVKLDGQDSGTAIGDLSLALIFLPFWILEATLLVSSLCFLIYSIYRSRRGFEDRLEEGIGLFVSVWLGLAPFLCFQAMFCVRDDANANDSSSSSSSSISPESVVSPILLLLAWLCLCVGHYVIRYRTPFQEASIQRQQESIGTSDWFDV